MKEIETPLKLLAKVHEAIVFEINKELDIHDLLVNINTNTIELQFKFKLFK